MKFILITFAAVLLVNAEEADPLDQFWNDLKIHRFHLEMAESEWEAMKALDPRKELPNPERLKKNNGEQRELHRARFPWAEGSLTINGRHLNGVGARYKGNASFNLMRGSLKRNMKIKLDWTNKDQDYKSV